MKSVTIPRRTGALANILAGLVFLAIACVLPAQAQQLDLSGTPATVSEGNQVTISVSINSAPAEAETVNFLVDASGACQANQNKATPGDDFVVSSGTLTFLAGSTASQSFTVVTVEDTVRENADQAATLSECLTVTISGQSSPLTLGTATQRVDITDDESNPTLSIADVSAAENSGVAAMAVTLSGAIDEDIDLGAASIVYTNVTAEGGDYDSANDFGTISAGTTSGSLSIPLTNDAVYEGTEIVNVQVPAAAQYTLSDGVGILTITDDESVPELSINSASAAEGANVAFTLSKSHAAEAAYNVTFSYTNISATSGSDYTPDAVETVAAGTTADQTVNVAAVDDAIVEGTETFTISIVDGADYDVHSSNGTGQGSITDNDGTDIQVTTAVTETSIDLDGATLQTTAVTVTVQNNGLAKPAADVNVVFTDTGFDFDAGGLTGYSYSGAATAAADDCNTEANLDTGSPSNCQVDADDLEAGESVTISFTLDADGAAGTTASLTATTDVTGDTDESNDADSDSATLVGLDFGDGTGTFAAVAHRITGDLYLGQTAPDAETGQQAAFAGDGAEDDGLQLLGPILQDATGDIENYLGVEVSAAGFLTIIARYDQTYVEVDDYPVVAGVNWVPFTAFDSDFDRGSGVPGALTALRLRVCAVAGECDAETDLLTTGGEVEDYDVSASVATPAATTVATLSIPTNTAEPVTISNDNTTITVVDGNGNTMYSQTEATLTGGITITGNANPNTLIVDLDNFDGAFDLNYDGAGGSDTLELTGGTTVASVNHTFTNSSSGTVIDGATPTLFDISYSNLEPILDNLSASARVMTFPSTADAIVLSDNPSSVDGKSFINSNNSEQVTFTNPTTSLTINAGDGADTIDFQGVDETAPNNSFSITFNGDAGADTITILPLPNTSSLTLGTVSGGAPTTCTGDALDINTTGGAVINTITNTAGTGSITFTSAHQTVSFTGIEANSDNSANLALSLTSSAGTTVNPADQTSITLSVTNNGPDSASCVKIDDILFGSDGASGTVLSLLSGPTFSVGSYAASSGIWTIGSLASGDTATITYTALVNHIFSGTASATVSSPESDSDTTDNSVSLTVEPAFAFPAKSHPTTASWYSSGANERLIVGLANGAAGLNSAVLCRVKQITGFPDDLWRECGDGLPYPLYVNDLYLDNGGTPADSTDDKLYLASWGSDGLYTSTDGGENFTAAEPDLGNGSTGWVNVWSILEDNSGFLYVSANNGLVFRSLNNGANWQQVSSLPGVASDTPWSMASHPTEAGRLYAGTFGNGVFTSDDFGFTWTKVGGSAVNDLLIGNNAGHVFDLELLPSSDGTGGFIFAATGGGVYRMSLDGDGESTGLWTQIDTDVTLASGTVTPEARNLAFDESEDLYVTTWGHGAFTTSAPSTASSMSAFALRGMNVSFVAISPSGAEVALGVQDGGLVFAPAAALSTTVEPEPTSEIEIPTGYALGQNYPNPFNPVTTIAFSIPETGTARLAVYDVLGREVELLVDGTVQAGHHQVQFDAAGLPTGTYIYRLETNAGSFAKQLVLMK